MLRRPDLDAWCRRARIAAFAVQLVALLVVAEGGPAATARALARDPRLGAAMAASVALGWLAASARGLRAARWTVASMWAVLVALDLFVLRYYGVLVDAQVAASAAHSWRDVAPVAARSLPAALALAAVLGTVNLALLAPDEHAARATSSERQPRPRPRPGRHDRLAAVVVVALGAWLGPPATRATPELRAIAALFALGAPREAAAASAPVLPPLASTLDRLPSVLFVLTESVRAEDACSGHDAAGDRCATTPAVDRLLPDRAPLRQMRSVSSYTALSFAAILTGRTQLGASADLAAAPTLFDLLHVVRDHDGVRPTVAYWSAQSDTIFARDPRPSLDSFVSLETLTGRRYDEDPSDTGFDRLLFAHADAALPGLRPPYVLFLHLFGTHAPYFVDEADAPFAPWSHTVSWAGLPALHAAYDDAIHAQDAGLAETLRAFVRAQGERPWAIVLTSDHGEAFGEHAAIHHGQNLYEEQIHVPAFVATSPGLLAPRQAEALRGHADAFVTHLDLLPTLLDLYGVLDAPALARARARFEGRSLLRVDEGPRAPVPITNCTALFPCPLDTWGLLKGNRVLSAQAWDAGWRCLALVPDGDRAREEPRDPDSDAECRALGVASRAVFPKLPNGRANAASP